MAEVARVERKLRRKNFEWEHGKMGKQLQEESSDEIEHANLQRDRRILTCISRR